MKGRWRKDKRALDSSGCFTAFPACAPACPAAATGIEPLWGRPSPSSLCDDSLRSTNSTSNAENSSSTSSTSVSGKCGSLRVREQNASGASNEDSSSSGTRPQKCNAKKGGGRPQKTKAAAAVLARVKSSDQRSSELSMQKASATSAETLLKEDLSFFSRRRLQAAAGSETGAAAAKHNHLKNVAYAAAQSLRPSEQLLCDGTARAALQQALEGGSIYLPAFCCERDDFSIFRALMKDLLLYALQQQHLLLLQQPRREGEQGDRRVKRDPPPSDGGANQEDSEHSPAFKMIFPSMKREEESGRSFPPPLCSASPRATTPGAGTIGLVQKQASPLAASAAVAAACSREGSSDGVEATSPADSCYWRELLRPRSHPECGSSTFSTPAARVAEAEREAAATNAAAQEKAGGGGRRGAAVTAATAPDAAAGAGEGMLGVVNWSCHLKHENPSFSSAFQAVVEKLCNYFCVKVFASRLNIYMDGSQWKPLHHDSHAYSSEQQQREDFTVGASFGATRALEFVHVRPARHPHSSRSEEEQLSAAAVRFLFPQRNGDVFAFNADVNKRFKHGVPPVSASFRFAAVKPRLAAAAAARGETRCTPATARLTAMGAAPPPLSQKEGAQQSAGVTAKKGSEIVELSGKIDGGLPRERKAARMEALPLEADPSKESLLCSAGAAAAGAAAVGDDGQRAETRARLEAISLAGATAAARIAAAATDGDGPRFSVIMWGRRKELNERNASLQELAALSRTSSKGRSARF